MKTYLVSWDVCFAVVNCETKTDLLGDNTIDNLFNILKERDPSFVRDNGQIKYDWGDFKETCKIEDVTSKKGIVFGGAFG